MAIKLWEAATSDAFNTTLNGSIGDSDVTITLASVATLQFPGVLVIDRTDGSGTETTALREYITYTGISGSQLTGVTRGAAGSTAQAHNSGAQVEEVMSVTHWGDLVDFLNVSHDVAGKIITSTATIANLRVQTVLNASGASIVGLAGTGGFNGLFQLPGSLPTTATDVLGQLPIPTFYTAQFINAFLRTPCSGASLFVTIKKFPNTTLGIIAMPAGATFASSASLAVASLAGGDYLTGDIDSSNNASDLSILIRAI